MRRMLLIATLLLAGVLQGVAQYPHYTIRQIQEVSADSLRLLDTLQRTQLSRWTLQRSPHFHDTVTVRGVCVVPAKVINYTSYGYNLLVSDPENPTYWGGLIIRPAIAAANASDTLLATQWGILNVEPGDTVEVTGWIDEFPANDPVSATQFVPLYNQPLNILPGPGSSAIPPFVEKNLSDFFVGPFPAAPPYPPNGIRFSTGEPMEFMRVFFTNLVVTGVLNQTNGTFVMSDQLGNSFSTMDASKWFTTRGHRDPASTYSLPAVGMTIDTIRGYIMTNSGQEAARGFRIAPLYPGDIRYGSVILPTVSTHRRYPIVVPPDSTPLITCRVTRGSVGIQSALLHYSVNNGAYVNVTMTRFPVDSTYRANIPQLAADTFVKYYITVTDSAANMLTYASSAVDGTQRDTLRGCFFYTVLNRPVTITDVQRTPFSNGRTPYLGALVTLNGIITADTASMLPPPSRFRGSSAWYMQNGNAPWSGIWIYNDTLSADLLSLQVGDSVAITGAIQELSEVTAIHPVSTIAPVVYSHNNPPPTPVVLPTNTFGPGVANGTIGAEQYESMLVQFNSVVMPDSEPTYQDIYEYAVDDGSNPVLVRRDGTNHFTTTVNDSVGKVLIHVNDRISFIRGIVFYAGGGAGFRYKLVPRTNADFGTVTSASVNVTLAPGWNMIANPVTVSNDSVKILYPTSINAYAFSFAGGYTQDYTMENGTGYWAKFPAAATQQVSGLPRVRDSITVVSGWNMVGTISSSVDTSTIVSAPSGIRSSNWFGYAGGYTPAVALVPGRAYWIKANAAGKFVLAAGPTVAKLTTGKPISEVLNSVTITDARGSSQTLYFGADANNDVAVSMYVMPPPPPAGAVDARFPTADGGSMVQTHPESISDPVEFPVTFTAEAYPVTVSWSVTKGTASYVMTDGNGGKIFHPKPMVATGSMELAGKGTSKFTIQVIADGQLPKQFALNQNYPNPFNPTTTIRYALPVESRITLEIFNVIGQRVRTLVSENVGAGYHLVEWDGLGDADQRLASGVYFLRLSAIGVDGAKFSGVNKLVMMK